MTVAGRRDKRNAESIKTRMVTCGKCHVTYSKEAGHTCAPPAAPPSNMAYCGACNVNYFPQHGHSCS